ncbi:TPA: IS66 family transposase [Vibrio vulnificus]
MTSLKADDILAQNAQLMQQNSKLAAQLQHLQSQLDWFKQQLFGQKSERRIIPQNPQQHSLFDDKPSEESAPQKETITYTRTKGPKQRGNSVTESGLRFDETVPVKVIHMNSPVLEGPDKEHFEVIDEKITHRLAQRPASYVVLKYVQPVVKDKRTQQLTTLSAPTGLFDKSLADVSFVAGMLLDKFLYHLPLYRQHQRLSLNGITLARSTLTNLTQRSIQLLEPIFNAQWQSALQSRVLEMDETPVKAGRSKPGKMKTAYFWPVLGDRNEICFAFSPSRGLQVVKELLKDYQGTLLTDGYRVYERYALEERIEHAQCWVHTRRYFINAEKYDPVAKEALDLIGQLYKIEAELRKQGAPPETVLEIRRKRSAPVVDKFFAWCKEQSQRTDLLPLDKLSKALFYALGREEALKVYLKKPEVVMDTNAIERGLRVIPMGKKNWMFCWSEVGAKYVGIIQSLLVTCRMHDIDPYEYLIDVLQRVSLHPAKDVADLTPRLWKEKFGGNPMVSDLDR